MSQTELLLTMARYNAWANAEIYAAVAALPPGEAEKVRPTLHKTLIGALNHLLLVDNIWWAHLHGEAHGHEALNETLHEALTPLTEARVEMDARLIGYVEAMTEAAAAETVPFTLIGGATGRMPRALVMSHIFNHNTYHRGFVAETFCQIPAPLPIIDLPVYLRGASGLSAMFPHFKAVEWRAV